METTEITAGRLHLRPWRATDADSVVAGCADPVTQRWTSLPRRFTVEHARDWLEHAAPLGWHRGDNLSFAVCDSTTGEVLGSVALRHRGRPGVWDVGYWVSPGARGRGVATEATRVAARWAFGPLAAQRVECLVAVGNEASRRTAEQAGFAVEGALRGALPAPDDPTGRADAWLLGRAAGDADRDAAAFPSYVEQSDGVVRLRRWRPDDAGPVARACDDPATARWLPVPSPYGLVDGRRFVERIVATEWAAGKAANVAVVDTADGRLLGAVGLRMHEGGTAEIGYWTAPPARGRGVAGRAALLHAQWAFDALGVARVELLTAVGNTASERAAEKAGFVREGVLRAARPAPRGDGRQDMGLHALLAPRLGEPVR